jgi:phenylacetate-CoA ligase
MTKTFMPQIRTAEELKAHQLDGLKWTVQHAYEGSPVYRNKLRKQA